MLYHKIGNIEKAELYFNLAVNFDKDYAKAFNNLGNLKKVIGDLKNALRAYDKALALSPNYTDAFSNKLFCVAGNKLLSSKDYIKLACQYNQLIDDNRKRKAAITKKGAVNLNLRIGMLSADFKDHPVGYFVEGLLEKTNSSKVEYIAFSNSIEKTSLTDRIRPIFKGWHNIVNMSDFEVANLIKNQGVDILIELSGHTKGNRLPIMAYKPAPTLVTWLGYFASTGVKEIDYILGDKYVCPEGSDYEFSEQILQLPNAYFCFKAPNFDIPVAETPAYKNGFITFGCFNNSNKINKEVVDTWSEILSKVPNSKIILKGVIIHL